MVTLAGFQGSSWLWSQPRMPGVDSTGEHDALVQYQKAYRDLCAPLATETNRRRILSYLETTETQTERLARRVMEELLTASIDIESLLSMSRSGYASTVNRLLESVDVLGEDTTEQLVGAVRSHEGLVNWFIGIVERVTSGDATSLFEFSSVSPEVMQKSSWASMCAATVGYVLDGSIEYSNLKSLSLLASVASDLMGDVEDEFLSARPFESVGESDRLSLTGLSDVIELPA